MSVSQTSAGQMSVDQLSVGQMSVGQMSVVQMGIADETLRMAQQTPSLLATAENSSEI
jgi:hypothetical protein